MPMVGFMAGLPVWLCAGKVVRIPPARPPAMRVRRDSLVSIVGMVVSSWVHGSLSAGSADSRPSTCSRTGTAKRTGALKIAVRRPGRRRRAVRRVARGAPAPHGELAHRVRPALRHGLALAGTGEVGEPVQ